SGNVPAKTELLRLARTEIVMVIEARLPNRHDLSMIGAHRQILDRNILLLRIMRMRAQRAVDFRKSLGDCENLGMLFDARGYGHERTNAGRACARHDAVELAGKIGKVEMTMAIDQRQSRRHMCFFCGVLRHGAQQWLLRYSPGTYRA